MHVRFGKNNPARSVTQFQVLSYYLWLVLLTLSEYRGGGIVCVLCVCVCVCVCGGVRACICVCPFMHLSVGFANGCNLKSISSFHSFPQLQIDPVTAITV